ncbi:MAG TPA: SOS response-associated peptidase [bacterium]|nr:SOS response-associated peptidase [bacterium]
MCGRFFEFSPLSRILEEFSLDDPGDLAVQPSYNIAPGQPVLAVTADSTGRHLARFRWGLIPSWARDESIGYKMINARAETAHEKPSFRSAFKQRRCLIIADGFYEWKREGGKKTPFAFRLADERPFGFAGLYEHWNSPEGKVLSTCTILTTTPNELIASVHDRMPVILPKAAEAAWLDAELIAPEALQPLLQPLDAAGMVCWEISSQVNTPQNNHPGLLDRLGG